MNTALLEDRSQITQRTHCLDPGGKRPYYFSLVCFVVADAPNQLGSNRLSSWGKFTYFCYPALLLLRFPPQIAIVSPLILHALNFLFACYTYRILRIRLPRHQETLNAWCFSQCFRIIIISSSTSSNHQPLQRFSLKR